LGRARRAPRLAQTIVALIEPAKTFCLARHASGQPKHPLNVAQDTKPGRFVLER
jgi:hypothetical protein